MGRREVCLVDWDAEGNCCVSMPSALTPAQLEAVAATVAASAIRRGADLDRILHLTADLECVEISEADGPFVVRGKIGA